MTNDELRIKLRKLRLTLAEDMTSNYEQADYSTGKKFGKYLAYGNVLKMLNDMD